MTKNKKIVITGLGPIASAGIGRKALWKGMEKLNLGIGEICSPGIDGAKKKYSINRVKDFTLDSFDIDRNDIRAIEDWKGKKINKDLGMMLASVCLALQDAKIKNTRFQDTAMVVTHENPGLEDLLWGAWESFSKVMSSKSSRKSKDLFYDFYRSNAKLAYETQSFMLLFHLTRMFKINKYSLYLNNACSSGLYALEVASDMIKCGKAEKVIVVASDCPDIFKCLWFDELGMYPKDGRIKPFSQRADGFILGEGAIAVVLENYDLARKRDVRVYGEYIAGSFKLESWKVTVPNPLQNCLADTISDVVQRSEMDIRDLDLICAHGVGTKINDTYEAKAIHTNIIEHRDVPVAAFKPYLGHTLGASALLEFAVLLLCMREQTILPILNVDATDQNSYLNLVRYKSQRKIKFALKTCCAFAGYNAATIIKNLEV